MKKLAQYIIGTLGTGVLLVSAGCTSVPVTGRSAINLASDMKIIEMSVEQFEMMKSQNRISRNPRYGRMVQEVGDRIAGVVGWDILNPDWEFIVFDDDSSLNAFALAGGKVGVFSGIFKVAHNEDDLAVVIGHEIGHVAAKHVHQRLSQAMIAQGAGYGLSVASMGTAPITQMAIINAYGLGTSLGGLGFNRSMEKEADEIGLMYAARAGFNPRAAIVVWERMALEGDVDRPAAFLSTHPDHGTRLSRLYDLMPAAEETYQKALAGELDEQQIIVIQ